MQTHTNYGPSANAKFKARTSPSTEAHRAIQPFINALPSS
jgi:hypothetical protein